MEEIRRNELEELKKFFVDEGWVDGFFQILFLLEDVKAGVYLQQERKRKKLKHVRNMLYWFDLYVSMRHGGYATKNSELYREWNKFFGFESNAEKFLGYPSCCVKVHNIHVPAYMIHLYSSIKEIKSGRKSQIALRQFLINLRFLHHHPCKINCAYSINLERKFEAVIRKYQWLVKDLLRDFDGQRIRGLIQNLELLPTQLSRDLLSNRNLLIKLEINSNDLREILENAESFRENLTYGKHLLESFL